MSDACQIPEYRNNYCTPSFHQGSGKLADSGIATKTNWKPTWRSVRWTSNGKPQQMTELTGDVHREWEKFANLERRRIITEAEKRERRKNREYDNDTADSECSMRVQCVWSNMSISNRPLQPPTHSSNINLFILIIIIILDDSVRVRSSYSFARDCKREI